jgi:hypothetical protein
VRAVLGARGGALRQAAWAHRVRVAVCRAECACVRGPARGADGRGAGAADRGLGAGAGLADLRRAVGQQHDEHVRAVRGAGDGRSASGRGRPVGGAARAARCGRGRGASCADAQPGRVAAGADAGGGLPVSDAISPGSDDRAAAVLRRGPRACEQAWPICACADHAGSHRTLGQASLDDRGTAARADRSRVPSAARLRRDYYAIPDAGTADGGHSAEGANGAGFRRRKGDRAPPYRGLAGGYRGQVGRACQQDRGRAPTHDLVGAN